VPLPDSGNPTRDRHTASPGPRHRGPPDPAPAATLPHAPVNNDASADHLTALCTDLQPGMPLLAMAYPEFSIGPSGRGRHGPAWMVIRKDPAQPGLYAAVTPDLGELRDILARHATQHAESSGPET
jgi:hypothetical protein